MNIQKNLIGIFGLCAFFLSSCTYSVHQVPLSDFKPYTPGNNGKPIEARGKQFVILGFANETNYVDNAYKQLQGQCVNGIVTGIAAKSYSEHGFFSWTNHIHMQGLCIQR
jgi:hypothetical protein